MDEYLGAIKIFAGDFAPQGWAFCNGQSLPALQYQALYFLIKNTYGGDSTNFNLPDLRTRVPVGTGISARSGSAFTLSVSGGHQTNTLRQVPIHAHNFDYSLGVECNTVASANSKFPVRNCYTTASQPMYASEPSTDVGYIGKVEGTMDVLLAGGGLPFNNMMPYVAVNYIICIDGIFPFPPVDEKEQDKKH